MTHFRVSKLQVAGILAAAVGLSTSMARADDLQDIGMRIMQSVQPSLNGNGVTVAQVEGSISDTDPNVFEFAPTNILAPITYQSALGTATYPSSAPPNAAGSDSGHADQVAQEFVSTNGVAPGVAAIYNYEALYFVNGVVLSGTASIPTSIKVINQSIALTTNNSASATQRFDNFIITQNAVVVSAAGNGPNNPNFPMPQVQFPATAYNGISVAALGLVPGSLGTDDGRSKIDITAPGPGPLTSFTTPYVSGIATVLVQAGSLNQGGAGTSTAATDPRTIKSLLLTGATKPQDWTHTNGDPLDHKYGAGIVNAYASYRVLTAGKFAPTTNTSTATLGGAHPALAPSAGASLTGGGGNAGWSYQTLTSGVSSDSVDHYRINLPSTGLHYMLTATLDWFRPYSTASVKGINNLDLYLYNITTNTEIAASTSTVDNVEQIYFPFLAPGSYDLQVLKHGGVANVNSNVVSSSETYALSWSAPLFADTNWDGVVDIVDFTNVANHWQQSTWSGFNGDIDGNGTVDILDFTDVGNNWQSGALVNGAAGSAAPSIESFGLAAVPEPGSLALLAAGAGVLLRRRRSQFRM